MAEQQRRYNARKAKAESDFKSKGSDKDKKKKGKGKGDDEKEKEKGKGKGAGKTAMDHWGNKGEGARGAAVDQELARAAAAGGTKAHFPRQGIGLDSWANAHLIHQKARHCTYTDTLALAHGGTKCHRETGRKGVPIVKVLGILDGDNIDLFLENFLLKRGCEIRKGEDQRLITPKGRVIILQVWGDMPYLLKSDLQRVLDDLPEASAPGRNGALLFEPTAARVFRTVVPMSTTRSHLKHLREHMTKPKLSNVCSKYKNLPDVYYGGDAEKFVTPEKFEQEVLNTSESKRCWEWYSGSSSLSQSGKEEN